MKKIAWMLLSVCAIMLAASCSDYETYAEKKDKEKAAIKQFIADSAINVISEAQFKEQNYTTNTAKNEYVLISNNGVYMQIVRQGSGSVLKDGETATILCRFTEYNILGDSMQLRNDVLYYSSIVDKMNVTNTSGTFSALFDSSSSLMYTAYSSTSVPTGWLVPLTYIKIGRQTSSNDEIAKVKLIVPHDVGQSYAYSDVYPCYYVLTYQRGL